MLTLTDLKQMSVTTQVKKQKTSTSGQTSSRPAIENFSTSHKPQMGIQQEIVTLSKSHEGTVVDAYAWTFGPLASEKNEEDIEKIVQRHFSKNLASGQTFVKLRDDGYVHVVIGHCKPAKYKVGFRKELEDLCSSDAPYLCQAKLDKKRYRVQANNVPAGDKEGQHGSFNRLMNLLKDKSKSASFTVAKFDGDHTSEETKDKYFGGNLKISWPKVQKAMNFPHSGKSNGGHGLSVAFMNILTNELLPLCGLRAQGLDPKRKKKRRHFK